MRLFSPGQTWRHLTEKRSLRLRHDGKAHSAYAPHGKAHSARQQSPRARLSVRVRPRVRFSVECAFPHLRKRGAASRKSAFCARRLTKSTLCNPQTSQATSFCETAQPECTSDSPRYAMSQDQTRSPTFAMNANHPIQLQSTNPHTRSLY